MSENKTSLVMAKPPPQYPPIPVHAIEAGWAVLDLLPFPVLEIGGDDTVVRTNRACDAVYGKIEGISDVAIGHAHSGEDGEHLYLVTTYSLDDGGILEFHIPVEETLGRDGLTGLYTRDFFEQLVARQRALLGRMELPYTMILLDIDHFKQVNDQFGHDVGDKVLREFGGLLLTERREGESVGRYGGEEFCIFMPGCDAAGAKAYANRLIQAIRNLRVVTGSASIDPTASIGVWSGPGSTQPEAAIKLADDALYRAKGSGRDCIAYAD